MMASTSTSRRGLRARMQGARSPPGSAPASPSAARRSALPVTPSGTDDDPTTTPTPDDITTTLFHQSPQGSAPGSKRSALDDNDDDDETDTLHHKRRRRADSITAEEVAGIAEEYDLSKKHIDDLNTFVADSPSTKRAKLFAANLRIFELLDNAAIDKDLALIKSEQFTAAIRQRVTAALLSPKIHHYGTPLTNRFVALLQHRCQLFTLPTGFMDNLEVAREVVKAVKFQIRQVRHRVKTKIQNSILNKQHLATLANSITTVKGVRIAAPHCEQVAFLEEPADERPRFWAFVDESLNIALEWHEQEDPATRDAEVLKYFDKAQVDDLTDFDGASNAKKAKNAKAKKAKPISLPSVKAASWQLSIEKHLTLKEDDRALPADSDDDEDGDDEDGEDEDEGSTG